MTSHPTEEPSSRSNKQPHAWLKGLTDEQADRQLAFYQTRVKHPKLESIRDDLMGLLTPNNENNVIAVVGPTGVGKSTLTKVMLGNLMREANQVMNADPSAIPVVYVQVGQDAGTKQGIKHLYMELLSQLQEPASNRKFIASEDGGRLVMSSGPSEVTKTLRKSLKAALVQRKTQVVVIDEATHLRSYGKKDDITNTIKTLGDLNPNTKWVFAGSYDFFDLLEQSGQVLRRSVLLSMRPYRSKVKEDESAFADVVARLQSKWPTPGHVPQFTAVAPQLLGVTLGCIGLLKSLLLRASAEQMRNKGIWNPQFLVNAALSPGALRTIEREIVEGEARISDFLYGTPNWSEKEFMKMAGAMRAAEMEQGNAI